MPRRKKQKGDTALHDIGMKFDSAEEVRRWLLVLSKLEKPRDATRKMRSSPVTKNVKRSLLNYPTASPVREPVEQLRSAPKYGNYVNHARTLQW